MLCTQILKYEEVEVPVSSTSEVPEAATKMDIKLMLIVLQALARVLLEMGAQDSEEIYVHMDTDAKGIVLNLTTLR
jgi:hypothetical protein